MDYCLYEMRSRGRTAIDRLLIAHPPVDDSPQAYVLKAMQAARFSVFAVESTEPGTGAYIADIFTGEPRFVADVGLSSTFRSGVVFCFHALAFEDFSMTSGAMLPMGIFPDDDAGQRDYIDTVAKILRPDEDGKVDVGALLRALIEAGAAESLEFDWAEKNARRARRIPRVSPAERNAVRKSREKDVCFCGSGKPYKRCCGKR